MNKRYKTFETQTLFSFDVHQPNLEKFFVKNFVVDRKSKFSWTAIKVFSTKDIKIALKDILKDKFYKKATHNIYAYRIVTSDGIIEGKNDDGEIGGWNCILSVLRNKNIANVLIIVTRYYGWIHLNSDRFKHIVNTANYVVDKILEDK